MGGFDGCDGQLDLGIEDVGGQFHLVSWQLRAQQLRCHVGQRIDDRGRVLHIVPDHRDAILAGEGWTISGRHPKRPDARVKSREIFQEYAPERFVH